MQAIILLRAQQSAAQTSYALGYLEGVLTKDLIWPFYLNFLDDTFRDLSPDTVQCVCGEREECTHTHIYIYICIVREREGR